MWNLKSLPQTIKPPRRERLQLHVGAQLRDCFAVGTARILSSVIYVERIDTNWYELLDRMIEIDVDVINYEEWLKLKVGGYWLLSMQN
jgi:hypothetical protein